MPVIDVQLSELDLVDARVVISYTHLSELLRRVIDQTNGHDQDIEELKKLYRAEKERGDELEALIKGGKERRKSMVDLSAEVQQLRDELEGLRRDAWSNSEKQMEGLKERLLAMEKIVDDQGDKLERETGESKAGIAKHNDQLVFLEKRLDSLIMPDMKPIEEQLQSLAEFRSNSEVKITNADYFIQAWSADPARLTEVCAKNKAGAYVQPTETRTEYILSLPPFAECGRQYKACDEFQCAALEAKLQQLRDRGSLGGGSDGAVSRADLAQLANEVKAQQQAVKNALDFLDRRMKDGDTLPRRVSALEEQARALGIHKADMGMVEGKADADKLIGLARQMSDLRDDVSDILDRLLHQDKGGDNNGNNNNGNGDGKGNNDANNALAEKIAARRRSSAANNAGGAAGSPYGAAGNNNNSGIIPFGTGTGDLARRVADLEVEAGRLEARKANREELDRFYKFLESVDPDAAAARRRSSHMLHGVPPNNNGNNNNGPYNNNGNNAPFNGAINGVGNNNNNGQQPQFTPCRPGTNPGSAGSSLPGITPRRPGTGSIDLNSPTNRISYGCTCPATNNTTHRLSSACWCTCNNASRGCGCPCHNSTKCTSCGCMYNNNNNNSTPNNNINASRGSSCGCPCHINGLPEANVEVRAVRTTEYITNVKGESPRRTSPARVFLGRSVAVVRDSGGNCTPASIGMVYH